MGQTPSLGVFCWLEVMDFDHFFGSPFHSGIEHKISSLLARVEWDSWQLASVAGKHGNEFIFKGQGCWRAFCKTVKKLDEKESTAP